MAGVDLGIAGLTDAEPVGSGGNAVVYQAREVDHDRWVAVKVLRGLADEAVMRRFDRERRAMGRLSEHDGIVTIYSSGFTENGEPYLVMPLMSDSLQDQLDRSGPMPWREAVGLIVAVARTVDAAHSQDVIHRDLKPGNILLTPSGTPLVADFGIARLTGSTTAVQSTALTFTPSYSAPEVLEGATPSKAADIYALGATLYALVSGTSPFATDTDESVFAVMQRIATQPVTDLRPGGVPDEVCAVIEQAMNKDPDNRHQSAAEFSARLEATLVSAGAGDPRETTIVDPASTVVVADHRATTDTSALDQVDPAPSTAPSLASPEIKRRRPWSTIAAVVVLPIALGGSVAAVIIALGDDPAGETDTSDSADTQPTTTATQDETAADATPDTAAEPAPEAPATVATVPETTASTTTEQPASATSPPVAEVPAPTGPPFRSWAVILDSFADCATAGVINSSEYPSLTPGLCVELGGTAGTEAAAVTLLEPCISAGCYVRYLGTGPPSGRWIVVWESLATAGVIYQEALAVAASHDAERALEFNELSRVLLGDDYVTFADGRWVVFSRDFAAQADALDWCIEIELNPCDARQVIRVDGD